MNLLETQKFILFLLLIFCFSAYKYDSKQERIKSKKLHIIYCCLMACFLQHVMFSISELYVSGFEDFKVDEDASEVTVFIHTMESFSLELGLIMILFNAFAKRKQQVRLLNEILKLEKQTKAMKLRFKNQELCYWKFKWYSNALLVGVLLHFSTLIFFYYRVVFPKQQLVVVALLYYISTTITLNVLAIFLLMLVKMIEKMFQIINCNLEERVAEFNECEAKLGKSKHFQVNIIFKRKVKTKSI